jgi:hypothetical protein
MVSALCAEQASVLPPSYQRRPAGTLHLDALTLVRRLHLLALCEQAVHLAPHASVPSPPAGRGEAPRVYRSAGSALHVVCLRYFVIADSIVWGVVRVSAWRCTTFQSPSSGRKMVVTLKSMDAISARAPTVALARSISTMQAR